MEIQNARYLKSAERVDQCPDHTIPEICFIGRSNVGKSSLINALTRHPKLAKTSGTPGKTRLLNFFIINDGQWCLVDLPGYGYAKVSQAERVAWDRRMQEFLKERINLRLIVVLVDGRHQPMDKDLDMIFWLAEQKLPFIVVLTKADKMSKMVASKSLKAYKDELKEMNIETEVLLTSADTRQGMIELQLVIDSFIAEHPNP